MQIFESFSDFEKAVLSAAGRSSRSICGAIGSISPLGLNELMYKTYLKRKYMLRFQLHKNDASYVNQLLEEASRDLRGML